MSNRKGKMIYKDSTGDCTELSVGLPVYGDSNLVFQVYNTDNKITESVWFDLDEPAELIKLRDQINTALQVSTDDPTQTSITAGELSGTHLDQVITVQRTATTVVTGVLKSMNLRQDFMGKNVCDLKFAHFNIDGVPFNSKVVLG